MSAWVSSDSWVAEHPWTHVGGTSLSQILLSGVLAPAAVMREQVDSIRRGTIAPNGAISSDARPTFGGTIALTGARIATDLGAIFNRAGDAIMNIRLAGLARMRFRRRR